jgi:TonB-dependent starch-binding outer membrane protein SusC
MKKKYETFGEEFIFPTFRKTLLTMKLIGMLIFGAVMLANAGNGYAQQTKFTLDLKNASVKEVLQNIENNSEFSFMYDNSKVDVTSKVSVKVVNQTIDDILKQVFAGTGVNYEVIDRHIILIPSGSTGKVPNAGQQPQGVITGKVTDKNGAPLPGVTVVVKGTTTGTITNADGSYSLSNIPQTATLLFTFVGMRAQEVPVAGKTIINISMEEETIGIEEVVAIGYGTMRKSDLTGSVVRANIEAFRESPNVSIMQSLQGSVAGLNVGQVNQSGEEPDIMIRGRSSLSGETSPLIIVDNVIFRGNLIDINPSDIESIDILKDASSAAIYGSQASNGVILITTTKSGGIEGKPTINYSSFYSFQSPVKELRPGTPEEYIRKTEDSDIFNSRTQASGYLERNPNYNPSSKFKTSEEIAAYNQGRSTDWYDLLTNDNLYTQNHNLSLANQTRFSNYLISLGYTDQMGYMLNEDFSRLNARINIDNRITDWLQVGIQSFMTSSDYSGQDASGNNRYLSPYATSHDENGNLVLITGGNTVNPLMQAEADHLDKRLNFFGNISANIDIPFVKGLVYKVNFSNNYRTTSEYYFRSYSANFEGEGSKTENIGYDWSADNILSFKRVFNDMHSFDVTLVYGSEKRKLNFTRAIASVFSTNELGYNRLQTGSADLQQALSGAWEEASLYAMGRLFYGFKSKYLFTGTIRRDGFSGFSDENKFGLFPSMSAAWVLSEEPFLNKRYSWLDQLKLRLSYGSIGNRTIGRYQTLARVSGGYNYITAGGSPLFTQNVSSLASPGLKWETTTGINAGIDFGILGRRISGSIEYYNNNTKDLLYEVDIPGISRFEKFPDNLGKLHNHGLEVSLTTVNLKKAGWDWNTTLVFSRNRNELKELLGFDNDGDGKEDDLISEGLFIGEPLDAIYAYKVEGKWQLNEVIPPGFDLGANKVVDLSKDGSIDAKDKTILGYREPSYRFSIHNSLNYGKWGLKFFITSIQGGKNRFMAEDDILGLQIRNQENHFNVNFPSGLDYWTPENPDGFYERPNINVSDGLAGTTYSQRNFIRLQDISLTYDFRRNLMEKYNIHNLKFYVSGKNLLTLSNWPGWDPETGEKITRNGLPVLKSISIGVNVEF